MGQKSTCPVSSTLEVVGDPWTLLIVRDIVFYGKHRFGEFLAAAEGITTSVLSDRLTMLLIRGILLKEADEHDRRSSTYVLTQRGLDLIPVLVELANWGVRHAPHVVARSAWVEKVESDREGLYLQIEEAVRAGRSVFNGPDSVIAALEAAGKRRSYPDI